MAALFPGARRPRTAAVDVEAHGRFGQAVDVVPPSAGLHIHAGVPLAAVVVVAGTDRQRDDALFWFWVVAIEPDGSVSAAVILGDAEGWHGVSGHAREAVPLSGHVAVTEGNAGRLVDVVVRVAPGLVQAGVGRARVQDWSPGRSMRTERFEIRTSLRLGSRFV